MNLNHNVTCGASFHRHSMSKYDILQNLFLLLMTCSGGACPRQARLHPTHHCTLASTRPVPLGLSLQARPHLTHARSLYLLIIATHLSPPARPHLANHCTLALPGFPLHPCP